jgi:hypothetical protein
LSVETQDPYVVIEDQHPGYVLYRNIETGRRWEVYGECVGVAECIVGAVVDDNQVETLDEAKKIWENRKDLFPVDNPITPEFQGCCPFTFKELSGNDQ